MGRLKIKEGGIWHYAGFGESGYSGYSGFSGDNPGSSGYSGYSGKQGIPSRFRAGEWSSGDLYLENDLIRHNGYVWLCQNDTSSIEPSFSELGLTYWRLFAVDGASGHSGASGYSGQNAEDLERPILLGDVSVLNPDMGLIVRGGDVDENGRSLIATFVDDSEQSGLTILKENNPKSIRLFSDYYSGSAPKLVLGTYAHQENQIICNTNGSVELGNGQLKFPATHNPSNDPNTLDDYEEGIWTPTIVGLTEAGTATYSFQRGTYVRIGRTVNIECELYWGQHTGSGSMIIDGLPFRSFYITPVSLLANYVSYNNDLRGILNVTQVDICSQSNGGAFTYVGVDTEGGFYCSATYETG